MSNYEAIKNKINKAFEDEIKEIESSPYEDGDDIFSYNIRKMHYKAEAKALRIRVQETLKPQPVTARYEPADDNGPEQHYYECPACYSDIADIHDSTAWTKKFCPYCGQPLDWSELGFDMNEKGICKVHKKTRFDLEKQNIQEKANRLKNMSVEEYAKHMYYHMDLPVLECPLCARVKCVGKCRKSDSSKCIKAITKYLEEEIV